jgi:hypothetical protein
MTGRIDVFISYKREERAQSERVKRVLIAAGYTAVTDLNIGKNEEFSDAIDTMIRTATLTLVLWTEASATSDWVRKEARLARDLEKAGKRNRYLGVMVEDVDLDLPSDLRGLQMVDIHDGGLDEPGMAQLLDAAREVLGPEAQQDSYTAKADSEALAEEWQLYDLARSINVAASYERYLARYPNGEFADDARRQLGMFTWYLHPFRRGNMSNTLAALGIVGTILATAWGASRDPVVIGVDPDDHTAILAERDIAITRAETLAEERNKAEVQARRALDALETERDASQARPAELQVLSELDPDCVTDGKPGIRISELGRCIALDIISVSFQSKYFALSPWNGIWQGTGTCGDLTVGVAVSIIVTPDDEILAMQTYHPVGQEDDGGSIQSGTFAMVGTIDPETNEFRLQSGDWLYRPRDHLALGFSGTFDPNTGVIAAKYDREGCGEINLRRMN